MFSLVIIFGGILLIDSLIQNSSRTKRKEEEAKKKAEAMFKASQERINKEVETRMKLWEDSGLPPEMWK